jgi:hypothetical protein
MAVLTARNEVASAKLLAVNKILASCGWNTLIDFCRKKWPVETAG